MPHEFMLPRQEMPLFENAAPIARERGAGTSKLAADKLTRSGRRDAQKRVVLDALRGWVRGCTSAELAAGAGLDRHMVARRLPDLEGDGLVRRSAKKECAVTGNQALTWVAVDGAFSGLGL